MLHLSKIILKVWSSYQIRTYESNTDSASDGYENCKTSSFKYERVLPADKRSSLYVKPGIWFPGAPALAIVAALILRTDRLIEVGEKDIPDSSYQMFDLQVFAETYEKRPSLELKRAISQNTHEFLENLGQEYCGENAANSLISRSHCNELKQVQVEGNGIFEETDSLTALLVVEYDIDPWSVARLAN